MNLIKAKRVILATVVVLCSLSAPVTSKAVHTKITKRSINDELTNPCGLATGEPPAITLDFKQQLKEMKDRSLGLKTNSANVQQTIETEELLIGIFLNYVKTPPPDDEYYFEGDNVTKTVEKEHYSITNSAETLQSHANLVSEMVLHIDYALKNGDLGVYGNTVLVEKIRSLKAGFKDLLCDIHIALRSRGSDLVPFFPELNNDFVNGVQPGLLYEYVRIYLFMNDGKRLSGFLRDMYEHMEFYLPAK